MGDLRKDFSFDEFLCPCCKLGPARTIGFGRLLDGLQALRDQLGMPIHVTSGYRCPSHNHQVKGSVRSYHMFGLAADIRMDSVEPWQLAELARDLDCFRNGGIIVYDDHLHLDVRMRRYFSDKRSSC